MCNTLTKVVTSLSYSDQGRTQRDMPPDRPDSTGMERGIELRSNQIFNFQDATYKTREHNNTNAFVESNSSYDVQEELPINEKSIEKNSHSDDDLTSLSWLHQQNLLKGLEISNPSKDIKNENLLNNNVCDDIADFSENTNSVSSLDDSYCSGKTHTPTDFLLKIRI